MHFLASVNSIKHRTILMTAYAAGLRVSEAIHLKVSDLDSQRMMLRVDQGKGRKDRNRPAVPPIKNKPPAACCDFFSRSRYVLAPTVLPTDSNTLSPSGMGSTVR
ncbi:tyrosine-type recombinase/integrase [Methylomonas sp.]|uniref:tyrosine-type recombinase/integrase n=1 Tax=Methylomonas sp. TaxID=418 RepID=UPI0025EBEDD9|nr:tyrosine-type recombinase/integrase [Methylomonas sp.]